MLKRTVRGLAVGGFLMIACATAAHAQTAPALPTRLSIRTILVDSGEPAVDREVKRWANLMTLQLGYMLADGRYNLRRGPSIRITSHEERTAPNPAMLEYTWNQMAAIQLVTAMGAPAPGGTLLQGGVYLGRLKGDLARPDIPLRQVITAANYQATRDVVTLAALYALAVDAGGAKAVACPLLDQARSIRDDLRRTSASVAELSAAIDTRLTSLRCRVTP